MKRILVALLIALFVLAACAPTPASSTITADPTAAPTGEPTGTGDETADFTTEPLASCYAEIRFSNGQTVKAVLYTEIAPQTAVQVFAAAMGGFYNGASVTVADGLMEIGDKSVELDLVGPEYTVSPLSHRRGMLTMWHSDENPTAATCCFRICLTDHTELDGVYTPFGKIVEGMDVLASLPAGVTVQSMNAWIDQ